MSKLAFKPLSVLIAELEEELRAGCHRHLARAVSARFRTFSYSMLTVGWRRETVWQTSQS
jgi:hypothetical protein